MDKISSTEFYAYLLSKGLITKPQLSECFKMQQELRAKGEEARSLLSLLLEKEYLTIQQLQQLKQKTKNLQIPGYTILKKLGEGGMGSIYLAKQESSGKKVAIKVLAKELIHDTDFVTRFFREARAATTLDHPHIVKGLDFGKHRRCHYFVMEYIEGENVDHLLSDYGAFPEKKALTFAREIVLALEHAHHAQIIHRDIKPGNIMVTKKGKVKLLDFGLAKHLESTDMTKPGCTMGTPYYLSPEQGMGEPVDCRSDLYSLGITLFHFVTGQVPFTGKNPVLILTQHLKSPLPDPRTLKPELSEACAQFILKLSEKAKEDRFQNPQEVLKALDAVEKGEINWITPFSLISPKNKKKKSETSRLKKKENPLDLSSSAPPKETSRLKKKENPLDLSSSAPSKETSRLKKKENPLDLSSSAPSKETSRLKKKENPLDLSSSAPSKETSRLKKKENPLDLSSSAPSKETSRLKKKESTRLKKKETTSLSSKGVLEEKGGRFVSVKVLASFSSGSSKWFLWSGVSFFILSILFFCWAFFS
jgi:serine/threonine protein kinase